VKDLILFSPLVAPLRETIVPEPLALYYTVVSSAGTMAESQVLDFYRPEKFPHWVERYKEQMKYKGFLRALLSTRYHFRSDPISDFKTIANFGKPVLLVWGRQDRTTPFAGSKDALALLDAEFVPVDEAGHLPHLEKPEIVHRRLISFLDRQAGDVAIADAGGSYDGL
jgi:pimeloyl-ACP methyl ester carboxylesterase